MSSDTLDTKSAVTKSSRAHYAPFVVLGLLLGLVTVSLWNMYQVKQLAALAQGTPSNANGVFLSDSGWKVGYPIPDISVRAEDGSTVPLSEVADIHNVVYIGADTCPLCLYQYPDLNSAADVIKRAGGSFAIVMLTRNSDIPEIKQRYGIVVPVYEIELESFNRLNLAASPVVVIFRRGILGDAFHVSTVDRLSDQVGIALRH